VNYWQLRVALPTVLLDQADPLSEFIVPVDPETGAAYVYEKTGAVLQAVRDLELREARATRGLRPPSPPTR